MSTCRDRFVWFALAGVIAAGAIASPALAIAKPLRVVPATPNPSADGTLSPAARLALSQGYLVPDQRAYDRGKAKAATANPSLALTAPVPAKRAPSTVSSWLGLSDTDFAPSDSTGAVGTQRFIQLVNSQFGIYAKGATSPMASGSLNTLAGVSSADTLFDVQVIWDPTTSRFYYTMIDEISQTDNALTYGYSKTASPSSGSSSGLVQVLDRLRQPVSRLPEARRQQEVRADRGQGLPGELLHRGRGARDHQALERVGLSELPKIKSTAPLMSNDSTFALHAGPRERDRHEGQRLESPPSPPPCRARRSRCSR